MNVNDLSVNQLMPLSETIPSSKDGGKMLGVTLIEALTQLAIKRWLIASVTAVATLMGLLCSLSLPTRYTSATTIMPPKQTQSMTSLLNSPMGGGSMAEMSGGGLSLKDPNTIYIGLLESRPIADAIIRAYDLNGVYHSRDMTAARKELKSDTKVVSERSGFISVSVTDRDKKRATAIANAYTAELRVLTKSISVTEASKRRLFFEERLTDARKELTLAEASFQQLQQNKGLVELGSQGGVIIGSLASVRGEIAATEVQLETLRSYSTEHNPDVQLVERELSTQQGEAARLQKHGSSSDFSDLGLKDVPAAGLEYVRAQRELQYRQAYFDLLLKQYEAARLDESKDAAIIQVVEPAIEADRKSSPQRMLITLCSSLAGFFAACSYALILWWKTLAGGDPNLAAALQALKAAMYGRGAVQV